MIKLLIFIILISFAISFKVFAGKKACQPYLSKLHNIQAQQRTSYNNSKGRSLAEREKKARDKWWQCEQGRLPKKRKKAQEIKKKHTSLLKKNNTLHNQNNPIVKSLTNNVVIKAKFHGQQQQDWLDYYQKPQQCKNVKTTKMFAYCIEDKNRQQLLFEQSQ